MVDRGHFASVGHVGIRRIACDGVLIYVADRCCERQV